MQTVAFCEPNKFCQAVLHKHWPDVPIYEDVRDLSATRLANDGIRFDVICGGFPCQDISTAGKGAGLAGERSGLWWEYHRLIAETRPTWVIAENVSVLRSRGLDDVLRSLAEIGYDAEWHCIPASAVGAPHRRDRIWIVAYPSSIRPQGSGLLGRPVSTTSNPNRETNWTFGCGEKRTGAWDVEPNVGRVADGVPNRLDRLKSLGNAVVPQIPQMFGEIMMRLSCEDTK
jgi:DNA (cytosine-5)-methyltransferase 1